MMIISLGILLLISNMEMMNVNAAGNTTDTVMNFKLKPSAKAPDYDWTSFRSKNNASAVYMKINYVKNSKNKASAWVLGGNGWNSKNCSGGNYYSANVRGKKLMTNYVREEGRTSASIKVGADPKKSNNIEGVWSPDSKR